jgi:hypothetical protein
MSGVLTNEGSSLKGRRLQPVAAYAGEIVADKAPLRADPRTSVAVGAFYG